MKPIDKNVPVAANGRRYRGKYPWDDMDVGDSFTAGPNTSEINGAQRGASLHSRNGSGKKYITRREGALVRVWRIE